MKKPNNQSHIDGEAQPIVSSQNYPNTESGNCNQFSKNSKFAKPTEQIFEVAPHQLVTFLWEHGVTDGVVIQGTIETELKQVIEWKGTLNYRRWNLEIKELRGRRSTKGQVHEDGIGWFEKQCAGGKFKLSLGGDR